MRCSLCGEEIRPDCILDVGICTFCFYDTSTWESNSFLVTRKEALIGPRKKNPKKRVGLSPVIRELVTPSSTSRSSPSCGMPRNRPSTSTYSQTSSRGAAFRFSVRSFQT